MRKIVLDTNCLLISLPKISPYRIVWDAFLRGSYQLCVSNEMIEEYLEILSLKINPRIATNVVSTILSSLECLVPLEQNVSDRIITLRSKLWNVCSKVLN